MSMQMEVGTMAFEALAGTIMLSLAADVAATTNERQFHACSGTSVHSARNCAKLWTHVWVFMFFNVYNNEEINASHAGCDEKTFRKCVALAPQQESVQSFGLFASLQDSCHMWPCHLISFG